MKRECEECGSIHDDYWMKSYDIGARTIWVCWNCWKNGQREATLSDIARKAKLKKIHNSNKRNK